MKKLVSLAREIENGGNECDFSIPATFLTWGYTRLFACSVLPFFLAA
jgi:hypothetical protein